MFYFSFTVNKERKSILLSSIQQHRCFHISYHYNTTAFSGFWINFYNKGFFLGFSQYFIWYTCQPSFLIQGNFYYYTWIVLGYFHHFCWRYNHILSAASSDFLIVTITFYNFGVRLEFFLMSEQETVFPTRCIFFLSLETYLEQMKFILFFFY